MRERDRDGAAATRPVRLSSIPHLRHARDVMDRRFAEPLDLDALAAEAGFSRFHFARSFRRAFGEAPGAYLTRRRMERAKVLLTSTNLTVTEIALLVGFASLGSFSSRFRALIGRTPTAYRSEHVAGAGPPPVPGCFVLSWARPTGGDRTASPEKRRAGPPS